MKIVGVSMVMNEADLIELFVRYHLQILDHLLVVEHASSDATPEILRELQQEGLPLEVVTDPRPQLEQGAALTELMRRAATELGADWVVPLDCDEFLASDVDRSVRPQFEKLAPRPGDAVRVGWRTYVPMPDDPPDEPNLLQRVTHRRRVERRRKWKVLVPAELARTTSIRTGNHCLEDRGGRVIKGERLTEGLHLAHFPVRSSEQIAAKALAGWVSVIASADHSDEVGWHVKPLFERLRTGHELTPEEITELALSYHQRPDDEDPDRSVVRDPVLSPKPSEPIVLRRPGQRRAPPIQLLADVAERIARELSAERRMPWWQRLLRRR